MFVCGCVNLTAHAQRSEDSSEELILSFHLYMASRDQTRVTRLAWQATFSNEPSHWPYYFLKAGYHYGQSQHLNHHPPASVSQVLGLQTHAVMLAACHFIWQAERDSDKRELQAQSYAPTSHKFYPVPAPCLNYSQCPGQGPCIPGNGIMSGNQQSGCSLGMNALKIHRAGDVAQLVGARPACTKLWLESQVSHTLVRVL